MIAIPTKTGLMGEARKLFPFFTLLCECSTILRAIGGKTYDLPLYLYKEVVLMSKVYEHIDADGQRWRWDPLRQRWKRVLYSWKDVHNASKRANEEGWRLNTNRRRRKK